LKVENKSTMRIVGAIPTARVFECCHSTKNISMIALFENSDNGLLSYCKIKNFVKELS